MLGADGAGDGADEGTALGLRKAHCIVAGNQIDLVKGITGSKAEADANHAQHPPDRTARKRALRIGKHRQGLSLQLLLFLQLALDAQLVGVGQFASNTDDTAHRKLLLTL